MMATYKTEFKLSIKDIDLIENSVRFQIRHLALSDTFEHEKDSADNHEKIIELMDVLSTLHNQKIWYGETHNTGMPLG